MNPEDILWRIVDRLQETKTMLEDMIQSLDPEKDKELMDALLQVEQLTTSQIHTCRRAQRRIDRTYR